MFTGIVGSRQGDRGSVRGYPPVAARWASIASALALAATTAVFAAPSSTAVPPRNSVTATTSAPAMSADSTVAKAVTVAGRGQPVRIRIPAIDVTSSLIGLGLRRDGTLQVPSTAGQAGWFTGAPAPGRIGPAIIVGHVRWNGQSGVFSRLSSLNFGDRIFVTRRDGTTVVFRVTRVSRFTKAHFPTNLVYGNIDHAGLRLITCDGFDAAGRAYLDNLVVFAMLD